MFEGQNECRIALIGKTGCGKSSMTSTILQQRPIEWRHVKIIETPGLCDTNWNDEMMPTIVRRLGVTYEGVHAVVYVTHVEQNMDEEIRAYEKLKALFNDQIARYTIMAFTGGDILEKKGTSIDRYLENLPLGLKTMLIEFNNRYVLFNNFARDPRPQVDCLLNMVRELTHKNGGPYFCPKYMNIGGTREEDVAGRMQELKNEELKNATRYLERKDQQQEASVWQLTQYVQRVEQKMERQTERLEKELIEMMEILKQYVSKVVEQEMERQRERQAKEPREMMEIMFQQGREDLDRNVPCRQEEALTLRAKSEWQLSTLDLTDLDAVRRAGDHTEDTIERRCEDPNVRQKLIADCVNQVVDNPVAQALLSLLTKKSE